MDDTRFDQLTRALGSGVSRRSAIKAALGLGAAAATGSRLVPSADAARRPTPTPKPIVCQAPKIPSGNQCVCPGGYTTCGGDCCQQGVSECCDGACCFGDCYGEELCCPAGSFVCEGVCRPFFEGACCVDTDCGQGEVCLQGECVPLCAPLGGSCSSDEDCCEGLCSAGVCYATIGGTCSSGADYCAGGAAEFCNGVPSCYCFEDDFGTAICADHANCYEGGCDACPEGTFCQSNCYWCEEGRVACIVPCPPDGGGCFTGETRIAMADGTSRAVAEVHVGDLVLGDDGAVNRVVDIALPLLGNRPLYALDGGAAFVTGSHPFQTDDGWKAIEPAESYRDHRLPGVRQLTVSDRLVRLAGVLVPVGGARGGVAEPVELLTEPMALANIAPVFADPGTQLYNLLLDGNHTYFANDLLVHNK